MDESGAAKKILHVILMPGTNVGTSLTSLDETFSRVHALLTMSGQVSACSCAAQFAFCIWVWRIHLRYEVDV